MVNRQRYYSIHAAHYETSKWFNDTEVKQMGLRTPNEKQIPNKKYYGTLDDVFRYDIENYMSDDILVKIDRASMASGLELRAPFLDVEFAEFCISLPYRLKIDRHTNKLILRKAYESEWPRIIRDREKQGFGAPVHNWLLDRSVMSLNEKYLQNRECKMYSVISYESCQCFRQSNDYKTWILLVLSLWMESHDYILDEAQ
jgi:asparagine synthase (glutamine-hydrolysing)